MQPTPYGSIQHAAQPGRPTNQNSARGGQLADNRGFETRHGYPSPADFRILMTTFL